MRKPVFLITCLFLTLTVASHAIPSPTAVDDNYYTNSYTVLVVPDSDGLLANDNPNTGGFVVTLDPTDLIGNLVLTNAITGAFTYDPGLFSGTTSFKYSFYEIATGLYSNEATARIQVPDAGATVALLGLAIIGLAVIGRRFA